ncbi:type IIS restriction enzyme Eco57I [Methanobrevibacter cuticularis]|uniref:site-specific DNA-methyltransferase (adenine-specific) n=1 Tax=Methanobrevibacter cuticularis TaxID=47311 RepID=A0A166EJS6_9EURY|nr:Eco57I restriction-modification methylase domain-containing protein [Methanobrevibacter cuticularis]KZX16733.1 type IIS restriction enzyme Eco57I [Methanobrevibacter cuticularis]
MSISSLDNLLAKLGLSEENGICYKNDLIKDVPLRIKNSLEFIDYSAIFIFNNNPLIIFKEFDNHNQYTKQINDLLNDIWNLNEIPILFVIISNQIFIYNSKIFNEKESFLEKLNINDADLDKFNINNISSGNAWKEYEIKGKKVQDYLLDNLKQAQIKLKDDGLDIPIIHNLFGRLLFSRYLIDRNFKLKELYQDNNELKFSKLIKNKKKLYDFFKRLKNKFNGDLFPIIPFEERKVKQKHLNILFELFEGTDLEKNQKILGDIYNFKIIPVELISNIYEYFLTYERLNKENKQKEKKAYYTPLFLVDYILDETLDKHLSSNSSCKILDPSCGSGVFLVESLRRIIEKNRLNGKISSDKLISLVTENIYGIDKDSDAINISIFSIYLTILDYLSDEDIKNFRFPKLKYTNFFDDDFFNPTPNFNLNKLKPFDLIIGNPPWGSDNGYHLDWYKEKKIPVSNKQIAESFLAKSGELISTKSSIALIVSSKILYKKQSKFMNYFLENFKINKILEFSTLRKEIFSNAVGPGAIIFYEKFSKDDKDNIIEHISLKPNRLFYLLNSVVEQKFDTKHISQNFVINNNWIWKVLLYGNILDINLMKRLKSNQTLGEYINNKKIIDKNGILVGNTASEQKKSAEFLKKYNYLDLKKGMLQRYFIKKSNVKKWEDEFPELEFVERDRKDKNTPEKDPEILQPPYLLMKLSVNKHMQCISTLSEDKWAFKNSVFAIKGKKTDIDTLKKILGVINSKLFTYFALMDFSSLGIERDTFSKNELRSIPMVESKEIVKNVNKILKLNTENMNNVSEGFFEEKKTIQNVIDNQIFSLFSFGEIEEDLVDYAINISIPMTRDEKTKMNIFKEANKDTLEQYANIFIEHFKSYFNEENNEFFNVNIINNPQFSGMKFNVDEKKPEQMITYEENNDLINFLGNISLEEKKHLYKQRDIKGFDEDYFYVIKPNEFKNWHPAVARHDIIEFMEALTMKEEL